MAEDTSVVVDEEEPFFPNLVCVAEQDFNGQEKGDLTFVQGEILTIVRQAEMAYWYVARNAAGVTGLVPKDIPSSSPSSNSQPCKQHCGTDFLEVQGTVDEDLLRAQRREAERRHPPGTLVIATSQFVAQSNEDMSFDIYEEMTLLKPMEDLCWYYAQKSSAPSEMGVIPITHVKLVYMSDDEDDDGNYKLSHIPCVNLLFILSFSSIRHVTHSPLPSHSSPTYPHHPPTLITHLPSPPTYPHHPPTLIIHLPSPTGYQRPTLKDRLYESREEFIQASGWYSYIGLPPTKEALLHVLAKKINLPYEDFMITTQAVYMLHYLDHEKVYVGKAEVLHKELSLHFDCFGKPRGQIRGIDDELCHHTDAAGWSIMVWPLLEDQVLEVEWNKKIIEQGSLQSSEEVGMNELEFTSMDNWDKFGKWFWPN
ncbi:hypothetical protein EMCRGX_G034053 [Ephydatia muelleri]